MDLLLKKASRGLAAMACGLVGAAASSACAATIDFTDLGTFTTPELFFEGGSVTGSDDINVLQLNGLGVVGGFGDNVIDNGEQIAFAFDAPVIDVSYHVSLAGLGTTGDPADPTGERNVEVFGLGGASLGVFAQDSTGAFALSDLVGAALITGFEITMIAGDFIRIDEIFFMTASEVPLPAALPLFFAGLAGLGLIRRLRGSGSETCHWEEPPCRA